MRRLADLKAAVALGDALQRVQLDAGERTGEAAPFVAVRRRGGVAALAKAVDRPTD